MLRQAGYHTALIGKADIYRDRTVATACGTAYRMREYGFDEPIKTGGQQQTCRVPSEHTDWLRLRLAIENPARRRLTDSGICYSISPPVVTKGHNP